MKVAVFHGAGNPIVIEDRPDAALGPLDVRIAVARCGICGSDVAMTSGSAFDFEVGRPFGHEVSGEVIEVGRAVSRMAVGDRLACFPTSACGHCEACRAGRPLYCTGAAPHFGGFGERLVIRETAGVVLPGSISLADGALVEPMACGRRALAIGRMAKGQSLLVLGAGAMALSLIYWARRLGAGRVVAVSRSAKRDELVMTMGADAVLRLDEEDPEAIARALGGPPDLVAECIGKPGMLALAIEKAKLGGTVLSMGMCGIADTIVPALATFKEVSVHFPLAYSIEDFVATVRAFEADAVRPEIMVSDTIGLDGLGGMLEELRGLNERLKVHVDPRSCGHG